MKEIKRNKFIIAIAALSAIFLPLFAHATTYTATQIIFSVQTNGSLYRVVEGNSIQIGVTINLASNSVPVKFDGSDELDRNQTVDPDIDGLYAAAGPSGSAGYCSGTGCTFTAQSGMTTNLPFQGTISIPTGSPITAGGQTLNLKAGDTVYLDIFPVLDLNASVDEPFSNSGAKVTLKIFANQAALDADCPPATSCPAVSGNPSGGNTTSPTPGGSSSFLDMLGGGLVSIINISIGVSLAILRWIIWVIGNFIVVPILESTLTMEAGNFATGVIQTGWNFVRDFVNMFFIVVLIAIGFATILRLENYNYKRLLAKLVIMALLVNFSLLIGRIVIEISDVVQFTFLPKTATGNNLNGVQSVRELFKNLSTVQPSSIIDGMKSFTLDTAGALAVTFTMLFQFILELGVIIVFALLAALLLIRTVALWILLILSPIAYAANILPATANFARRWWGSFLKYVFFAPVIAFFLRLTYELYTKGLTLLPPIQSGGQTTAPNPDMLSYLKVLNSTGNVTFSQSIELSMVYVVILAFLIAAIFVTRYLGVAAGATVVNWAEKGFKGGAAFGSRYAFRGTGVRHIGSAPGAATRGIGAGLSRIGLTGVGQRLQTAGQKMQEYGGKPGAWIEKKTAYVEGAPGAVKRALTEAEKARAGQVRAAQRTMVRGMGYGTRTKEDIEDMNEEEVKKLFANPAKLTQSDIQRVIQNASFEALRGALDHLANHGSPLYMDGAKRDAALQAIWNRMGGGGLRPTAMDVTANAIPAGAPAGTKPTYAVNLGPNAATRTLNTAAFNEAFEKDLMDEGELKELGEQMKKLERRKNMEKAIADDPANQRLKDEMFKLETSGAIPNASQAADLEMKRDALNKRNGVRVEAEKSQVSPSGQRIIIGKAAAEKGNYIADEYIASNNQEGMSNLVQSLRADGVSEIDISKVVNAAKQSGGVSIQRGNFAALKGLGGTGAPGRVEFKQHERSHGFYNYIKTKNEADYRRMTQAVKSDPKYKAMQEKFQNNENYRGMTEDQIAEEIIARGNLRDMMTDQTKGQVNSVLDTYRNDFQKMTRQVAEQAKTLERSQEERKKVMDEFDKNNKPSNSKTI